ncbi:MAG: hypothetical protein RL217_690 [Pseudomonadota bacterium]|jgi:AraC-like DNA-binding protein
MMSVILKTVASTMTENTRTVSILWFKGLLQAAVQLGLDSQTLLSYAKVNEDLLSSPYARITLQQNLQLWRAIESLSSIKDVGLRIGEMVKPSHFQLFAFTLMHSASLGAAFEKSLRYTRLLSDGGQYYVSLEGERVALCYEPTQEGFSRHQVDAVLVLMRNFAVWLACRPCPLRAVEMRHAPSECVDEYERIFNAPLMFNSERNALILDRAILDEPLSFSDDHLALVHEQMLEAQLVLLQQMDISGQVRHILLQSEMLTLDRDQVAEKLHMSSRSLQRKLQECSTSFQKILDEERNQRACQLLRHSSFSLTDISAQLGFAESSVFSRAFKRWNGIAPLEYRLNNR